MLADSGQTRFWGQWFWGWYLKYLRAGASLLLGGAGVQQAGPGAGTFPLVGEAGTEIRADFLVGGTRAQGLLSAHWWVKLYPGVSG